MENLIEILPNIYGVKVPMKFEYTKDGLLYGKYKILGTITAKEISFDASEVVESQDFEDMDYDGNYIEVTRYWDYEYKQFECMDSDESFRSALTKEIYFDNPIEKPIHYDLWSKYGDFTQYGKSLTKECTKWQTAQQNITEKLLILQKL